MEEGRYEVKENASINAKVVMVEQEENGLSLKKTMNMKEDGSNNDMKKKSLNEGGTVFDGFLLAASQEVGQVILTLPFVFSLVGMKWGIILQGAFATLALYTNFLLVSLHAEYRHKINTDRTHPYFGKREHIVSYHEIISNLIHPLAGKFTLLVVFGSLIGLSTVQIIATSSNFAILNPGIDKRTWSIIWGSVFLLMCFIPNFRHYRFMSLLGIMTTTYVAWYMTAAALMDYPYDSEKARQAITYSAPMNYEDFFRGLVGILFTFGGHSSNIEVADVMDDHTTYDKSYMWSFIYVFTLTVPNAIASYHTYGDECMSNGNAFNLYPSSYARDIGIILMSLHQMVAFGLFSGPLYHIWEKFLQIESYDFKWKAIARIPLACFLVFMAIAFPFFGPINGVLGAFTTSLTTYIIPLLAYSYVFWRKEDQLKMVKKPSFEKWISINFLKYMNLLLGIFVIIVGLFIGGYASIKNLLLQIELFEMFSKCYQC